jgi:hypothetical protein
MAGKTSSIVTDKVQLLKDGQYYLPTGAVLVTLVIALVVLKLFIYIKDPKRDGK